ncbi:MAG: hypothetical protein CVV44_06110 [Spirochaetae bacterium HGW-Spirochaetae-1]|nr:MAG: hypothetical protein CVV44_06110 [Spirochaetae bacterium HGW-Spirochaetae-1]
MNQRNSMNQAYIRIGEETLNLAQFITKVKNYDVELTRGEILSVIRTAQELSPADVSQILNTVKQTYHVNMSL